MDFVRHALLGLCITELGIGVVSATGTEELQDGSIVPSSSQGIPRAISVALSMAATLSYEFVALAQYWGPSYPVKYKVNPRDFGWRKILFCVFLREKAGL